MENFLPYLQNTFIYLFSLNVLDLSAITSTSFLLIAAAEIGDKTQLAAVALSSTTRPIAVWIGATLP